MIAKDIQVIRIGGSHHRQPREKTQEGAVELIRLRNRPPEETVGDDEGRAAAGRLVGEAPEDVAGVLADGTVDLLGRAGAGGVIALEVLKASPANGYTIAASQLGPLTFTPLTGSDSTGPDSPGTLPDPVTVNGVTTSYSDLVLDPSRHQCT